MDELIHAKVCWFSNKQTELIFMCLDLHIVNHELINE